jgi:hypothetical protein
LSNYSPSSNMKKSQKICDVYKTYWSVHVLINGVTLTALAWLRKLRNDKIHNLYSSQKTETIKSKRMRPKTCNIMVRKPERNTQLGTINRRLHDNTEINPDWTGINWGRIKYNGQILWHTIEALGSISDGANR